MSYFVEHHSRDGRIINCTIGTKGIRAPKRSRVNLDGLVQHLHNNHPEMAVEDLEDIISEGEMSDENGIDPMLISYHSQPSVTDTPDGTEYNASTTGSQLKEVYRSLETQFSSKQINKVSKSLEQLILMLIGFKFDTCLEAVVMRAISFLSGITEGGIVMTIKDSLLKYVGDIKTSTHTPTGFSIADIFILENSNTPEMAYESSKMFSSLKGAGQFTKHFSYIIGTVFAVAACKIKNVEFDHPTFKKLMAASNAETVNAIDLLDHATQLYNYASTVIVACIEQKSFQPMFLNSGTLAKAHAIYYKNKSLLNDMKASGVSTSEARKAMLVEMTACRQFMADFVKVNRDTFSTLSASSLYQQVEILFNDVRDFVCKIDAVKVPVGIHMHGPPKVGKSTLTAEFHEQICLARGVIYNPENCAQLNLLAQYQDELNNSTQCITINETLPIKEQYAKSTETAYNTALSLVDPVPYHPNRSNLEDKAKITMQHISVVSNGNEEEPFLHVARTHGAWCRRYLSFFVKVHPKYADEFERFDASKADGSGNYHLIDIYEIIYSGHSKKRVYQKYNGKETRGLNTRDAMDFVRIHATRHFAEQDMIDKHRRESKRNGCPICKRLARFCVCNTDHETVADYSIRHEVSSVISGLSKPNWCRESNCLGGYGSPCIFEDGTCVRCLQLEPPQESENETGSATEAGPVNEAEMGVVGMVASAGVSVAKETAMAWLNPFCKLGHLYSIDDNTFKYYREQLVQELLYWPDTIGCGFLSLFPERWETRSDGSPSLFGRGKDSFIRMLAAERQIFMPLTYLLRRAFTWACIWFCIACSWFYFCERYLDINYRKLEVPTAIRRTYRRWEWIPVYPEWSAEVFMNRDAFAEIGIRTTNYLDWSGYLRDLYTIQRWLGMIAYPWWVKRTSLVIVLEVKFVEWWRFPLYLAFGYFLFFFFYQWFRRACGFHKRYEYLKKKASSDKDLQCALYEKMRRHPTEYNDLVPTAVGLLGIMITGLVLWNKIRNKPELEIDREKTKTDNWSAFFNWRRDVPVPATIKNMASSEFGNKLSKCLTIASAEVNGKTRKIHGLYMEGGILLLPGHFFKIDPYKNEFLEDMNIELVTNGYKHKAKIYKSSLKFISGKDLVLVHIPDRPVLKDPLYEFLPKKTGSDSHKCVLMTKMNGDFSREILSAKYEDNIDCAGFNCGRGVSYISTTSGEGACGGIVYTDKRDPTILAFHIAGAPHTLGSRKGFAQELLYDSYCEAVKQLKAENPSVPKHAPEMKTVPQIRRGKKFWQAEGPHPKSIYFQEKLPSLHGMKLLGHNTNLDKYRSCVKKTTISDAIAEFCNRPNVYKAPDFKAPWECHNKAMDVILDRAHEVPPEALRWAVDDYLEPILKKIPSYINQYPHLCQVLTEDQMINGVEGSVFMRALNMSTSVGPPEYGSKLDSDLFIQLDDGPEGQKRYGLSNLGRSETEQMVKVMKSGEKYGAWVKTHLKDEVVAEDSNKIRIFYIMESLLAIQVRKYYLPVVEFISRNPLLCECAVGINCASKEWETMMQHVEELATDGQMTDWDYSKYDLRRSHDVTIATLNVYRRMAEMMGYRDDDLYMMDMIADELRNPIINWNGTVLMMFLWPSGNSITVYGNGGDNSLHQRVSFYTNGVAKLGLPEFLKLGPFRDNERIITYGDDGLAGSKPGVRSICDFPAKKSYFDSINMKITDAAKSATPAATVPKEQIDFLKRRSVLHPELGVRVGALDVNSIWKMGHMTTSKEDPETISLNAITTMLMEMFLHGEEEYEQLRTQLTNVARSEHIWTEQLEKTYDDRVIDWKSKYDGD